MTEDELLASILEVAEILKWLTYHTHDSRRSPAGFPDLVLVREHRILYRELKRSPAPGLVTPAQREWLHRLRAAGADVDVWTPQDWPSRVIAELRDADLGTRPLPPMQAPRPRKPRRRRVDPAAVRAELAERGRSLVPQATRSPA